MPGTDKSRNLLLGFIAFALLLVILKVGQPIIVLVVFALFLAILLQPLGAFLDRFMPNWLSIALVVLFIGVLLGAVALLFYAQARSVAEKAPEYGDRFQGVVDWLIAMSEEQGIELKGLENTDTVAGALAVLASGLESIFGFAGKTLLVLIMTIFMLLEATSLRSKIESAFGDEETERIRDSLGSMTRQIQRYVTTKTLVSLVTGVLTGVITYSLGVDFPVIWGAMAFQLNFIPHIGSIIAVFPPALVALVQFDSPNTAIATFLILGSTQFTIGNIIEPRIMGQTLELSPVIVFISMIFWGWFWGAAGIMLAVPLTAAVRIMCLHVPSLRPFAVLLGSSNHRMPSARSSE